MRSSNKRSRSKNNRNRPSGGNVVNRVFDSSGPEGKVRGTPQQIIDKYNQLTRDAQLSGDRVAAENFAQHAEHYTRMLAEAQREMDQKREQHDQQNQNRQQNADQTRHQGDNRQTDGGGDNQDNRGQDARAQDSRGQDNRAQDNRSEGDRNQDDRTPENAQPQEARSHPAPEAGDVPETPARKPRNRRKSPPKEEVLPKDDVIDTRSDEDSGLVETPENAPKPRRTRKRKSDDTLQDGGNGESQAAE